MNVRPIRLALVAALALATIGIDAPGAEAGSQTYTVHVDGRPPRGESWAFLRFFPGPQLSVHQGDVVEFAWNGTDTPHTATVVPDSDPEAWRTTNQGPGGSYESPILDTLVGGDDGDLIENPAEVFPSDPSCGTETAPCAFDGTGVTSSGLRFSDPGAQPFFFVAVDAPVGTYSFLCLLHRDMALPLNVVVDAASIPTPEQVSTSAAKLLKKAIRTDGEAADEQAQTVVVKHASGTATFRLNAGGFSNGTTANEFPDDPLTVHVGDKIRFSGTGEIHTATFPRSSFKTTPLVYTVCEQPGTDTPATSPLDCADPSAFQIVENMEAILSTTSNRLSDPTAFVNSGLLVPRARFTFVAKKPGTYALICLVHGPEMADRVKVLR